MLFGIKKKKTKAQFIPALDRGEGFLWIIAKTNNTLNVETYNSEDYIVDSK
jgi:superoxide dismutase